MRYEICAGIRLFWRWLLSHISDLTSSFETKLSDLKAMIVNTGGRKARPYRRVANP